MGFGVARVSVRAIAIASLLAALTIAALPASAGAHAERATTFPDPDTGAFPQYRTTGTARVVCTSETKKRIKSFKGDVKRRHKDLLRDCRYNTIQAAVNAAQNNTRILVMPGTYPESPSRGPAPAGCEDVYQRTAAGQYALAYSEQRQCPHAQNLIAVLGDSDGNGVCDSKCNIQIEGTGPNRTDALLTGDRAKLNILRADRADGIYIKNLMFQYSDFNNIYVLETNGFRIDNVLSRWSREYGILSFTSDHGIYENCETYGSGDSGIYPGSGPERHGQPDAHGHTYGIEIRNCNSHKNNIGSSGTAGNGTWFHHNRFHHNAIGMTTDSFAGGHPGMPQDSSKFENNLIYSNNFNIFSDDRDEYCKQPPADRDPTVVCPTFQVPVGTGILIAGGNDNIVAGQLHLRQLAPRHDAALGAGELPRRARRGEGKRHVEQQRLRRTTAWGSGRSRCGSRTTTPARDTATPTASTSGGTSRRDRTAMPTSRAASTSRPRRGTAGPGTSGRTARRQPPTRRWPSCRSARASTTG